MAGKMSVIPTTSSVSPEVVRLDTGTVEASRSCITPCGVDVWSVPVHGFSSESVGLYVATDDCHCRRRSIYSPDRCDGLAGNLVCSVAARSDGAYSVVVPAARFELADREV